jgi:hypothetical protein
MGRKSDRLGKGNSRGVTVSGRYIVYGFTEGGGREKHLFTATNILLITFWPPVAFH